jgi:hypothetical protein
MSFLNGIPSWAGNIPVWTLLIIVLGYITIQWQKNMPVINQQRIDERLTIKSRYSERITELEAKVEKCREDCAAQETSLRGEITSLQGQNVWIEEAAHPRTD